MLNIIKTIEFISISTDGLDLLQENVDQTMDVVAFCFHANQSEDQEMVDDSKDLTFKEIDMLYAAATILLDLTANEENIEKVSENCQRHDMFRFIIQDNLIMLLDHEDSLKTTQLKKLRDLFIGMTLNLTCNIDDPAVIFTLLKEHNVLSVLLRILKDIR